MLAFWLMLLSYKNKFAELLSPFFQVSEQELLPLIQIAPDNVKGDLAFPCFQFAKSLGKAPNVIASEVLAFLQEKNQTSSLFSEFYAVGPYVNVSFNTQVLASEVLQQIKKEKADFGAGEKTGKTILLEGWAPNTHKSVHIGHVRNSLLAESIARILKFAGNKVIKTCYPGDIGAHVAKWIWYYKNFDQQPFPEQNFTKWVGQIYTLATRKVDENPDLYKPQIEGLQKALEDWDSELVALWKETRALCLQDMKHIFAELGSAEMDKRYYESDVEQPGIRIVEELLAKGIATKSQGATVMDLEEFGLGVFLLLKSTGASLYSTKDIALAYQKKSDFPDYDQSLYVVGLEQEHHFQQLFKTLELIGFDYDKLKHISYGLVDLADGKMSSRAGNVVLYEDFRDELLAKAEELVADRDLPAEKKAEIAHDVAFAAMKFGMLLQDSEKGIIFDKQTALSFEWETGPYLQYMSARISSIFKKVDRSQLSEPDFSLLTLESEKNLILQLASFPDLVQKSASEYKPNGIARFALSLAKQFSSYYHEAKIRDESNIALSTARLALIEAVQCVMKNALELLGISTPESM